MMVYSQLYRSVAVLRAQCKAGSVIACFEAKQLGILYGACAKFSAQSLGRGSEIQYGGV